ncbi:hypothetical protein C5S35_14215 [Candidatus Methanophagaceae archaeon]|nr:hypothetical protein C5S35_14215 [Methanophagales archaeon]
MGGKHEKEEIDKKENRQPQKFSWDNVPGDDTDKLISFLKDEFDIDWADDAEITKSDDGMTISISTDEHSAEIIMDGNKKKATLKIRDGKTHYLKVKEEDGKLNIYFSSIYNNYNKLLEIKNNPALSNKITVIIVIGIFTGVVGNAVYDIITKPPIIPQPTPTPSQPTPTIQPTKLLYNLTKGDEYIHIWEPCKNSRAPEKGWLVLENSFYNISINLDSSYYMIFDKKRNKDILVYDDTVKNELDILTGCDLGFGDHDGDNTIHYATTALHDTDGIVYEIAYEDKNSGFVLIDTKGWDTREKYAGKGYDVEAEVLFGIFANKPYFINAVELSNLQRLGLVYPDPIKVPDEIVQSWVIIDEYQHTCMKGGDNTNADMWGPPLLYNVTLISKTERKPWHVGSASFSKMFPEHILLGDKIGGGGIIFSLPEGIFRFDDSLGVYGDQIAGEFIINVEKPQKAIAFTVNPVNELLFFYDFVEFNTVAGYKDLMRRTCEKYGLEYPTGTLDAHNWKTKRYAYVITLTDQWYDVNANQVSDEIWALADQGLEDFYFYQEKISNEMEATTPLSCQ